MLRALKSKRFKPRSKARRRRWKKPEIPLQDTALRAPMNSVVLERKVEAGTLVSPGTLAFIIADTTSVKAVFGVPDLTVESLRLGSPITVTSQAALGQRFSRADHSYLAIRRCKEPRF